jgi:hypothetical protein
VHLIGIDRGLKYAENVNKIDRDFHMEGGTY